MKIDPLNCYLSNSLWPFCRGEIAVICQDVKLLKERFDSGVALSKSISSGQTSCILASSSSSLSNSTSSDQVPNHGETYKTSDGANLGASVDKSSPRREPKYENATGADEKEHADEGWELCDAWPGSKRWKVESWEYVSKGLGLGFWQVKNWVYVQRYYSVNKCTIGPFCG